MEPLLFLTFSLGLLELAEFREELVSDWPVDRQTQGREADQAWPKHLLWLQRLSVHDTFVDLLPRQYRSFVLCKVIIRW